MYAEELGSEYIVSKYDNDKWTEVFKINVNELGNKNLDSEIEKKVIEEKGNFLTYNIILSEDSDTFCVEKIEK